MDRASVPLAVQISNIDSHYATSGRTGLWGLIIFFGGIALICLGLIRMQRSHRWRKAALPARGRIADNVPQPSWRGRKSWLPVLEFEASGVLVMTMIQTMRRSQGWPLGNAVDLIYDASNPHRAELADAEMAISAWLIVGLGVVATFMAVAT